MKKWTARQKLQMKRQIALISAVTLVVLLLLTGSLTAYQSIRAEQWRKAGRERKTGVVCQGYQAGNTSCASYS